MPVTATYDYTDENKVVLYQVLRIEPGRDGRKKDFSQRRPDGNGGWIDGLGDTKRVLYNLPAVLASKEVAIMAGEKDCLSANRIGMVATTNSGGEGVLWVNDGGNTPDWVLALSQKHCLLFPDTDGPGRIHAENVILALNGIVASLAVVWVPAKDFTEYLESGATSADLNKLIELAKLPENSPVAKMQKLVRRRANLTAIESEKLVLGSVMAGRTTFSEIDHLASKDFSIEAHKLIFEALKALEKAGSTDRAAVVQHLEEREQLEKCGGLSGLLDMTEDLPTAYNVESHTETIQKRSADRKLLKDLCSGAEDMIVGGDTEEIRQRIITNALCVVDTSGTIRTTHIKDVIGNPDDFLKPIEPGIMCRPLYPLFRDMYGLREGQLVVIGARPAQGKSSLMSLICAYSAAQQQETEIFSFEVSQKEAIVKMACMTSKVSYLSAISGQMSSGQKARLYECIRLLSTCPLRIDDKQDWTIAKIRAHLRKRKAMGKPVRVAAFDYLQLMSNGSGHSRRDLEVGSITRGLKLLALEFQLTIILLSQLNRESEKLDGRLPRMSDLRESGSVEQDADIILLLWQDYQHDSESEFERPSKIILAKQRNGPSSIYDCHFSKPYAFFYIKDAISPLQYTALLS